MTSTAAAAAKMSDKKEDVPPVPEYMKVKRDPFETPEWIKDYIGPLLLKVNYTQRVECLVLFPNGTDPNALNMYRVISIARVSNSYMFEMYNEQRTSLNFADVDVEKVSFSDGENVMPTTTMSKYFVIHQSTAVDVGTVHVARNLVLFELIPVKHS